MSTKDFLPREDSKLVTWTGNFAAVCAANKAELGLTPDQVTAIGKYPNNFSTVVQNVESAKQALKGTVGNKDAYRKTMSNDIRAFAKQFKSRPGVSQGTLDSLGIVASNVSGPVVTVNSVVVAGFSDGNTKISWNRNGNSNGTIFVVEYSVGTPDEWEFAGAITKTSFVHEEQTPGTTVWYRVISTRAGKSSAPSVPVASYPNGGSGDSPLRIAA